MSKTLGFFSDSNKQKEFSQFKAVPEKDDASEELTYWFPQYLSEDCPFKNEYNAEWKKYLISKNSEEIQNSVNLTERFIFYSPKIVQSVFDVCKIFRQPPDVRYLAVDIFDRFLVKHFLKLIQTFEEMEDKSSDIWERILERVLEQSTLRILSCVQLAMKYSWRCNIVSAIDIQEMLKFLGHKQQYSKKSVLKSEARIYQNLNYEIPNKTPFTYLEMFFDEFQRLGFFNIKIPLKNFFETCIYVLDVAIIFHRQIYSNVVELKKKTNSATTKNHCVVSFKANFIVLVASVIFASSVLEDPSKVASKILLPTLCSSEECEKPDIEALGKELLDIICQN